MLWQNSLSLVGLVLLDSISLSLSLSLSLFLSCTCMMQYVVLDLAEQMNIVELDIERINNPVQTDDGTTCHFIDRGNIEVHSS